MKLGLDTNFNETNMEDVKKKLALRAVFNITFDFRISTGFGAFIGRGGILPTLPPPSSVQKRGPDFPCRIGVIGQSRAL